MYKEEELNNHKIIAMIIGLGLLTILIIFLYHLSNKNYENAKIDSTKNYIYARDSVYSGQYKNIPYINVKGDTAAKYNDEILQIEQEFASVPDNRIGFVFNKSNEILSLSIKIVYYDKDYPQPIVTFKTYILNLKTKKAYTKKQIYEDYGVNDALIEKSIEKKFKKMYRDVVKKGYVDSNECDYECFLKWRNVDNYLDDVELYIEYNDLIVFKGFATESIFGEEEYFDDNDFKFEVER